MTAKLAAKASFHGRSTTFFLGKERPSLSRTTLFTFQSGFHERIFSNFRDRPDTMFSATILLVFAMLQCSVNVLGNPFLRPNLEGWQKAKCAVRILNHDI